MSRPRDPVKMFGGVPEFAWELEPMTPTRKNRPKVAKTTRQRIYERDRKACVKCGARENLTIDHIVPLSKGGKNRESNMQTMCQSCNHEKGSRKE